jgi:hypothetical protein
MVEVDVRYTGSADDGPRRALVKLLAEFRCFFSICRKHIGNCVQQEIGSSGFARISKKVASHLVIGARLAFNRSERDWSTGNDPAMRRARGARELELPCSSLKANCPYKRLHGQVTLL